MRLTVGLYNSFIMVGGRSGAEFFSLDVKRKYVTDRRLLMSKAYSEDGDIAIKGMRDRVHITIGRVVMPAWVKGWPEDIIRPSGS
jgi:hypothetical protein